MKYLILSSVLFLMLTSCKYGETLEAFELIEQSAQQSQHNYENEVTQLLKQVTDSAMANPERYASAFNHANEFHSKTENLLTEIKIVKDLIDAQIGESKDFETMDQNLDEVFFDDEKPSEQGKRLKKALENYLITSEDQLYFFPEAEKIAKSNFSTVPVMNRNEEETTWLEYHFKGYPAIASRTKLTLLEQRAYEVQVSFLGGLLENPQF